MPHASPILAHRIPDAIHCILDENGTCDGTYNVCLTLDWNPLDFFARKGMTHRDWILANTFTVTGDVAGGVAARGLDFLVRHYNCSAAVWVMGLLDKIAREHPVAWMAKERGGRKIFARVRGGQTVLYLSTPCKRFVADVAAILAWVGAAFQKPCGMPVTYCTASMRDEGRDGHWSQLRISYELERVCPLEDHCWYYFFRDTVIVRGHEHLVPRRSGLIMTEEVLVGVLGPAHVMASSDGRALLKSKFALLIPTRFDADEKEMTWRLVLKKGDDDWYVKLTLDEQDRELVMQLWGDEAVTIGPWEVDQANWHVIDGPGCFSGFDG